jgi:hypothetical protein
MSVIIYQDHIELLEEENLILKQEVMFLRKQLEYKSLGNLDTTEDEDVEF